MKNLLVLFLALFIVACASSGNQSLKNIDEQNITQKLVEGKSTKNEVRSVFGSPFKTSFTDGGLEIWTYELSDVKLDAVSYIPVVNWFGSSASGNKKELVILFTNEGVVKKYSMSKSAVSQKTGVFK